MWENSPVWSENNHVILVIRGFLFVFAFFVFCVPQCERANMVWHLNLGCIVGTRFVAPHAISVSFIAPHAISVGSITDCSKTVGLCCLCFVWPCDMCFVDPVWHCDHHVGEEGDDYFFFCFLVCTMCVSIEVCLLFLLVSLVGFVLWFGNFFEHIIYYVRS